MRNTDNPSTTFFWNDWDNEPGMKYCGLAARGLWMTLLSLAARSREYGVVVVGDHPSLRQDLPALLAPSCGETMEVINELIDSLVTFKVASIDEKGRLINRRMVAEARLSAARSSAGSRGAAVTNTRRQTFGKGVGKQVSKALSNDGGKTASGGQPECASAATTNNGEAGEASRQNGGNPVGKSSPSSFFTLSSVSKDTGAEAPSSGAEELDPAKVIFGQGLAWLIKATGKSNDTCRKLLGKWRSQFGSDEALIVALGAAIREGAEHPESWMQAAITARAAKVSPRQTWAEALP